MTPNGDGLNDVFRPDNKTLFVKSTKFKVFNRWGVMVYNRDSSGGGDDVYINWPGTNSKGERLTDGIYYYEVEVEFYTIDSARAHATYKGWVEVVR